MDDRKLIDISGQSVCGKYNVLRRIRELEHDRILSEKRALYRK